jgi:adenylate kinase family enzyme
LTLIVISGAPGTGKSTIARELGVALRLPVPSLDPIKEALAEGWWRGPRRDRAVAAVRTALGPEGSEFCLLSPL